MGVDRTWHFYFRIFEVTGFSKADELWKSVQQNLIAYINSPTAGGDETRIEVNEE